MKHGRAILLSIAMFIALAVISFPQLAAQPTSPRLITDQPIYSLWHIGGTVTITASKLVTNQTYYLWLQRPNQVSSRYAAIIGRNGTASILLPIAATDPSGTYLASLSTSGFTDTGSAVVHFGIFGTDARSYERTGKVVISGGGFAPNSTITIGLATAGQTVNGFPQSIRSQLDGGFNYTFKLPPSANVGALTVNATGPNYDNIGVTSSVSTTVNVNPTSIKISRGAPPPATVERTAEISVSYLLTYPDSSGVTTASAGSSLSVVRESDAAVIGEVPLQLSNSSSTWTAVWVPPPNATLASYHFELAASSFMDPYGNHGQGPAVDSASFAVGKANVSLSYPANSTLERAQDAHVVVGAGQYHDGSNFENVTAASGNVIDADGVSHALAFNSTLNALTGQLKIPVDATLGKWRIIGTMTDLYGNTASGEFVIQIVKANLKFAVDTPPTERTTMMKVTARVSYPDGTTVNPSLVSSGFNITISQGNFTWRSGMSFNDTSARWTAGYLVPINATLGDYSVGMVLQDIYGNGGGFNTTARVTPARFTITVPHSNAKANSGNIVDISISVLYPNGTSLNTYGGVVFAYLSNSSGTYNFPMTFNVSNETWHEYFTTPDPGLSFGKAIHLSFSATDKFGNSGIAANAYELDVGAGTGALVLATVIGGLVPIGLLGWAIATISKRRRTHKP